MHSFHQSRSRIAFEVLCALTVSASCAAAWMQVGATAFLPASVATGLYGLWHLTDMRRPKAARVALAEPDLLVDEPTHVETVDSALVVADAPAKPKKRSRKKQPAVEAPAEPAEAVEAEVKPSEPAAPEPVDLDRPVEIAVFPDRAEIEEELHPPIAPLFEAKPFAHQQRPTFGRKAG